MHLIDCQVMEVERGGGPGELWSEKERERRGRGRGREGERKQAGLVCVCVCVCVCTVWEVSLTQQIIPHSL